MAVEINELSNIIEKVLSFAGLIAIVVLIFHWIKKLTSHNKEMIALDKDVRSALRESLGSVKEVREIGHDLFSKKCENS